MQEGKGVVTGGEAMGVECQLARFISEASHALTRLAR